MQTWESLVVDFAMHGDVAMDDATSKGVLPCSKYYNWATNTERSQ